MNGYKFYALISSLTIVAGLTGMPAIADQQEPSTPTSVDSASAGQDRGRPVDSLFTSAFGAGFKGDKALPLDQLFARITANAGKAVQPAASTQIKSHPATVVAHRPHHAAAKPHATISKPAPADDKDGGADAVPSNDDTMVSPLTAAKQPDVIPVSTSGAAVSAAPVVEAHLDRPGQQPTYKAGDHMVITLKANHDCNVLVFDFDSQGNLTQLYPNAYEKDGTLRSGQTVQIGGPSSDYTLDIDGSGMERIFVYASPLSDGPITLAMKPVPNTPFRAVSMTAEQFDTLVSQSKGFPQFDELVAQANDGERSVKVVGKKHGGTQQAAYSPALSNNKVELVFKITR